MTYKTEAERREDAPSKGELAFQEAVDNANRRTWWSDHSNIHFLLEYLNGPENETEVILDLANALDIVEKPWHFTDEFIHAVMQYVRDTESEDPSAFEYELGRMLGAPRVHVETIEVPNEDYEVPVCDDCGEPLERVLQYDDGREVVLDEDDDGTVYTMAHKVCGHEMPSMTLTELRSAEAIPCPVCDAPVDEDVARGDR